MEGEAMRRTPSKRLSRTLLVALVAVALMIPVVANAAAGFVDVDDSNVFVDDIQWMADNGITAGCNPPTNDRYCPTDNVTRQQMAAFMRRLADAQVVDAGTLNGLEDTAFMKHGTIVTTTGGTAWQEHILRPTVAHRNGNDTEVSGDGVMVLPLTAPTNIAGVEYGLASFELCIARFGGTAFVTRVTVAAANDTGGNDTILSDLTDISATGCYSYEVGAAAGHGVSVIAQTDGSASQTIRLGSIKATWTPAAASS
jgi:hypothetical protein